MDPNSIEFIYRAMNAIASGKYDPETERRLSDAIHEEILAMNSSLVLERWHDITVLAPEVEAHIV